MGRAEQLKSAFEAIHFMPLEREDAAVILELAQLVVDVDDNEATEEIQLFFTVGKVLHGLAEIPDEPIPTFASHEDDEERMFDLATQLKSTPVRELAFAVVRSLAEADLEIAPVEDTFIDRLRGVLSISRERATEIDFVLRSA